MKQIGILAPIFSLPNNYGIGDFSECSYKFIDFLSKINYSVWQILPLNPTDKFGCPYTSISSFAFDDIYVSLEDLKNRGLIVDYKKYSLIVFPVNYKKVREYKQHYFNLAFLEFKKQNNYSEILNEFIKVNPRIKEYAEYVVLRRHNSSLVYWNKWKITDLNSIENSVEEIECEIFKQYILFEQWNKIHEYAKAHNVTIMGDMPFYVGFDSADLYYNRGCFLLDEKYNPTLVAGVPPDYYSEEGQLWGNPVYNWEYLKSHQYSLMTERILFANKIYDITRLDHFRAFDTYYVIDSEAKTAIIGEWKEAPGYDFFDYLFSQHSDIKLIAEDLGDMREEVFHLRDHYNLPGMQVIQFTFTDEEIRHSSSRYINKRTNSVVYLSTHDSTTGLSWYESLDSDIKTATKELLEKRYGNNEIILNLFKYLVDQPANTVILNIFDILRFGNEGRINVPGEKSNHNWKCRFKKFDQLEKYIPELISLAKDSGRQ